MVEDSSADGGVDEPRLLATDSTVEGNWETPAPDMLLPRRVVWVQGWALSKVGRIGRIDVLVDGVLQAPTCIDMPRPDIASWKQTPESILTGYWCFADLTSVGADVTSVRITVVVHTTVGTSCTLGERSFAMERPAQAVGDVEVARISVRARPSMRRVFVVTHSLARGGSERLLVQLLCELARARQVSGSVVTPRDGAFRADLEAAGYTIRVIDDFGLDTNEGYERRQHELIECARASDADLVLANSLFALPGVDAGIRLGLPTVWKITEPHPPEAFWDVAYPPGVIAERPRVRTRSALDGATAIMVGSTMQERYAAPGRRVVPLNAAIDVEEVARVREIADRNAIRDRLGVRKAALVFLVLGTVAPHKMQTLCVRSFAESGVAARSGILAIVGAARDEYGEGLRAYVTAARLTDRVRLFGPTDHRLEWVAASDVLVCPSQYEGLPLAVLEALAFERVVVASDVGAIGSVVRPGETGVLVRPGDAVALEDGLTQVMALSAERRAEMGRAGASIVRTAHALPQYLDRCTEVLEEAVATSRG